MPAPVIHPIGRLVLPKPERIQLSSGPPLYVSTHGNSPVIKLEVVLHAGRTREHLPLVASATGCQLKEGTAAYTGAQIAEELDYYGYDLSTPTQMDYTVLSLSGLTRHLPKVLPLLANMLARPSFPAGELATYRTRNKQSLEIDLTRASVVGFREISAAIFGEQHPYGYNSSISAYDRLQRTDLALHQQKHYRTGNAQLFLSGYLEKDTLRHIDDQLSGAIPGGRPTAPYIPDITTRPQAIRQELSGQVQQNIYLGRRLFSRSHPDYAGIYFLNTLLGGYFGSRLIQTLREEKGWTYHAGSFLEVMRHDTAIYLHTDVAKENTSAALDAMYSELDRLRQEPVEAEELKMVRNYLLGSFMTMLDGPFNQGELVRTLYADDMTVDFFGRLVEATRHITAADLQALAQRYFDPADWWDIVVG